MDIDTCLKKRGLKGKKIKEAIIEILNKSSQPLAAEEILARIEEFPIRKPTLNTIYRSLRILMECQIIKSVTIENRKVFTMKTYKYEVCHICGEIIHFEELKNQPECSSENKPNGIVFYAVCKFCNRQNAIILQGEENDTQER
ncbi:transcriptional repressor [Nitratiruptor sp. YY09-18]|uniref:transcriptional repressor n=1 Tax=Nitratiruptor sp. YY09-18 TaxID=2724901 RepID=UPI0019165004|nr:transcriptional repressor [Nitratiruptor sp. YY09-18]BCD68716.1 Fur family transcriptional regulator, ferric uptake regulator [Nitratiruptor sp. YY09-18]